MPYLFKFNLVNTSDTFNNRIIISLLMLIITISSMAQENTCRDKLIGDWQVYHFNLAYKKIWADSSKHLNLWKIGKNSVKIGSYDEANYVLDEECKRFLLIYKEREEGFLIREFYNDSLKIEQKVAPHESTVYWLRKIN